MAKTIRDYLDFSKEDNNVKVKAEVMRFYIPDDFFLDEIAIIYSNQVEVFSNFIIGFKDKEDSKEEFFAFDFGVSLRFNFKEEKIIPNPFKDIDVDKYHVFELYKGQTFINSLTKIQSLKDAQSFIDLLNGGKLPIDVKYSDIPEKIKRNFNLNGLRLPVSSFVVEMLTSEINRNKDNLYEPFRIIAGSKGKEDSYQPVRLKDLSKLSSVFSAISFEDMNSSIKAGVVMIKNKVEQKTHPLENVIKY